MPPSRRTHLPPDLVDDVDEAFARLENLERPGQLGPAVVDPRSVTFSFAGPLVAATSSPYEHPTGGFLLSARCTLTAPGLTDTVLRFARNGSEITPQHSAGGQLEADGSPSSTQILYPHADYRPPYGEPGGVPAGWTYTPPYWRDGTGAIVGYAPQEDDQISSLGWFARVGEAVIPAGHRRSVIFFHAGRFAPDQDGLTIAILSAGLGAASLTVRTDWGG